MDVTNLRESPLVQGATEAKRPTAWWLAAILVVVVGILAIGGVVAIVYGMLIPNAAGSIAAQWMEFFTNAGTLVALWLWLRFKEQRPFSSVGFRGGGALLKYGIDLAIGAGMITLVVLILLVSGQYQSAPAPPNALSGAAALLPMLLLVIVWAVQSGTEETLMRGYLLQTSALQLPRVARHPAAGPAVLGDALRQRRADPDRRREHRAVCAVHQFDRTAAGLA